MPSIEVLLPIGAIGFYLFDAALMLYGNELALERRRTGWGSSGGYPLQLFGRLLFLPNPFAPGRLLFRMQWDSGAALPDGDRLDVAELHRLTRPLQLIALIQALLLLVALPPVSLTLGAGNILLMIFAAFYALSLAAIAVLIARRRALRVSNRQCAFLALEALACAPFAVNLVRKISLTRSRELNWPALVEESFTSAEKQELAGRIFARVDEQLDSEDPDSSQALQLQALRDNLQERLHVTVTR